MTFAEFITEYVLPAAAPASAVSSPSTIDRHPYNEIVNKNFDAFSILIVENLKLLIADKPVVLELLSSSLIIRSGDGKKIAPKDLYDPHIPEFQLLLPESVFPLAGLYSDVHLIALRSLGMHTSLSCHAIVKAASVVESCSNRVMTEELDQEAFQVARKRGEEILKYIDRRAVELLKEADAEGYSEFSTLSGLLKASKVTLHHT